ncbi:MAG: DHHA1 domain-containing protein, partial [Natronomonas sp.]|uniref:alanyl-tRNA editing protein n=1 Tax=Natronomonas sp. TaxID=2184060 RepID=UPI00286FB7AB
MSSSKAPDDPDTLEFEATVERGGTDVVLSETYLYPEGGGQPADRGTLGGHTVLDVRTDDGAVVHVVDEPLDAGSTVSGIVDAEFRRYCARSHTASHALYGAGRRLFDDLGYGGFGIDEEKVRVDFATSTPIDDAALVELERLVNRCVWESRAVDWRRLPREDALARDDVAFNAKTEDELAGETVRIVEIDGWDVAACGGTHVSNTREIGPVTVLERSNPGEGMTRVEFSVGPAGIDRRAVEKRAVLDAARTLGTGVGGIADAVGRIQAERDELRDDRDDLRQKLLEQRVAEIADDAFERDGLRWAVGVVEADANALSDAVRDRPDELDVLVLAAPDGSLAVGAGPADAGDVVDELTERFGGGGGGSPDVAQAGGLDADGASVVAFL